MIRLAKPTKQLLEWADAELGIFFHYDIEVFHPEYDSREGYRNYPPVEKFAPVLLDTDEWVKIAAEAGAKYALLTAKHGTGFCLWPTKLYEYSVRNTRWREGKGDIERVVMMEDQSEGQKIRKWVLEGLWPESWGEGWFEMEKGCSIGHKRILEIGKQRFTALRLRVLEAAGEPVVRSLAVYGKEIL